jgi:signal transduction histidine kinase
MRHPFQVQYRARRCDGAYRWILDYGVPLSTPDGALNGYIGCGIDITDIKASINASEEALISSRAELRELAAKLLSAEEEVRKGVSRELHDDFGQALTALKMDIKWLGQTIESGADEVREKVADMSDMIDLMIEQVRGLAQLLRPAILDDLGVAAAFEWHVGKFSARAGLQVDLSIIPDSLTLDPDRSITLFRILQEALTNTVRHARASLVSVTLRRDESCVELLVSDDGVGLPPNADYSRRALGLAGMRERVVPWNGEIWISSGAKGGTTVHVMLPLDAATGVGVAPVREEVT